MSGSGNPAISYTVELHSSRTFPKQNGTDTRSHRFFLFRGTVEIDAHQARPSWLTIISDRPLLLHNPESVFLEQSHQLTESHHALTSQYWGQSSHICAKYNPRAGKLRSHGLYFCTSTAVQSITKIPPTSFASSAITAQNSPYHHDNRCFRNSRTRLHRCTHASWLGIGEALSRWCSCRTAIPGS
jgi:hypothetical protein